MIGSALANELLNRSYDVIILTRSPEKYSNTSRLNYAKWDIEKQIIDGDAFTKADYIVHLAGEGIAVNAGREKSNCRKQNKEQRFTCKSITRECK